MPREIEETTLSIFLTNINYDMSLMNSADSENIVDTTTTTNRIAGKTNIEERKKQNNKVDDCEKIKRRKQKHQERRLQRKLEVEQQRQQLQTSESLPKNPIKQIKLHIYFYLNHEERVWLFTKEIPLPKEHTADQSLNKWIQLDLNKALKRWMKGDRQELIIQIYCERCTKYGIKIYNNLESSHSSEEAHHKGKNSPALNIIGRMKQRSRRKTTPKTKHKDPKKEHMKQPKQTICQGDGDTKCCRHTWIVDFAEMEEYNKFVIQPQAFDAGYCEGSCPYRYNLGNTHAYIQSLVHHTQKDSNVPDVCCAATRLVDMDVLHVDEDDPTKLKVSPWKKMRVMKCSCT